MELGLSIRQAILQRKEENKMFCQRDMYSPTFISKLVRFFLKIFLKFNMKKYVALLLKVQENMYTFCQTKCLPEYVYENDIKIWNINFFS